MAFDHYISSGGKMLRCGFTTGTCAALATSCCVRKLLCGQWPETVSIVTPKGWTVEVVPEAMEEQEDTVIAGVRKDAGDDIDKTAGAMILAKVRLTDTPGVKIDGGEGIGRVTKPGLDQPVGEAAINSVPRKMIRETAEELFALMEYEGGIEVIISCPEGAEIGKQTFNPNLGIEGGISILGTSGIVEPMSMQALVDTIQIQLRQSREMGFDSVILTPGNYGLDFLRSHDITPPELPVVRCSNFIGDALDECQRLEMKDVLLTGHIGKLVKLAGGIMNTHSRYADCRTELFCTHAALAGAGTELCQELMDCATTDACIAVLDRAGIREEVMERILEQIQKHLDHRSEGKYRVGAVLFSNVYGELGRTSRAKEMIEEWN